MKKFTIVSLKEIKANNFYSNMAVLAGIFNHEIWRDEEGTLCWVPNALICLLKDHVPIQSDGPLEMRGRICLNTLQQDFYEKKFDIYEYMKFYMGMGYSLGGFIEVFGQHEAIEWGLEGALPLNDDKSENYAQTPIDYVIARAMLDEKRGGYIRH